MDLQGVGCRHRPINDWVVVMVGSTFGRLLASVMQSNRLQCLNKGYLVGHRRGVADRADIARIIITVIGP